MMPRPYKELKPQFDALAEIEPRLSALERRAAKMGESSPAKYGLSNFYSELKPMLCTLVGYDCHNPDLEGEDEYNVVYQHILNLATRKSYRRAGGWCK